jgi:hypothetical protein
MFVAVALKALSIWAVILVLAIANGTLREAFLIPRLGNPAALVLSGLGLSALIMIVAYMALPWFGVREPMRLLAIGIGWLVLTLIFELSFGLWQGKSWGTLFGAYTFQGGNIWPAVLLVTALAPLAAGKLRGWV